MLALISAMLMLLGCTSCSNEFPLADIQVAGTSQQETCMYLYFRIPEGARCAGVRIRNDGQRRLITFLQSEAGAEVRVDSRAILPNDVAWEGNLRVEIPIDPGLLEHGGEEELVIEGRGESKSLGGTRYPDRKATEAKPQQPSLAPGR